MERQHTAEAPALPFRNFLPRMFIQSDIQHIPHFFLRLKPFRERQRIFLMLLHTDGQRFHAPQDQPAVKRRQPGANRLKNTPEFLRNILSVHHKKTAQRIVMSFQIFRRAVNDNIRAKIKRILEIRCQKGIINREQAAFFPGDSADRRNIRHLHHGIGRRFQINELRIFL